MPVTIDIKNLQTIIPLNPLGLKKAIRTVLKHNQITQAKLSFVFVNDTKIKALNTKYLRHNYATDVLTFDFRSKKDAALDGEVIVSTQTAKRNAKVFKTSVKNEIMLYMIHGILHLLGFDDHSPSAIKKMRVEEKELMSLF